MIGLLLLMLLLFPCFRGGGGGLGFCNPGSTSAPCLPLSSGDTSGFGNCAERFGVEACPGGGGGGGFDVSSGTFEDLSPWLFLKMADARKGLPNKTLLSTGIITNNRAIDNVEVLR